MTPISAVLNPWEISGRLQKAYKIAQALFRAGITSSQALLQTPDEWISTAACAGCKAPSAETRRIAIEKLQGMEEKA